MLIHPKVGRFVKGIAFPGKREDLIKACGINSVRLGKNGYPFDGGAGAEQFRELKESCAYFTARDMMPMVITPTPASFVRQGVDLASEQGLAEVTRVHRRFAEELLPYGCAYQLGNELNLMEFRQPLTLEQSVTFVAAAFKGIREGAPRALVGYNVAYGYEQDQELIKLLSTCVPDVDYVGLDAYFGSWKPGGPQEMMEAVDVLHALSGLPVLVQEFGFGSAGDCYTEADELEYLRGFGYESRAEVLEKPEYFLDGIPYHISAKVRRVLDQSKMAQHALGQMPHLLRKWPAQPGWAYMHTPQGQAAYIERVLEELMRHPHVMGAFVFRWSDAVACPRCGSRTCPVENSWGLTDAQENPKPAYEVVKRCFTKEDA